MMDNLSVPSRFACLKIEDDEPKAASTTNANKKNDKRKNGHKKTIGSTSSVTAFTSSKQNLATKKPKGNKKVDKQWEEWKRKDNELVNDNFEQDMQNAILQSKLEYEAKKTINGHAKTSKNDNSVINKKKKTKTMYLDQFLESSGKNTPIEDEPEKEFDESFMEKMREDAKREVIKSKVEEERKEREAGIEKVITISQIQEKLIREKTKNAELQKTLDGVRLEAAAVKARNRTLCTLLGQGEIRDKAEILLELDRLSLVKDELTEEVSKLHKLLEQERSKTAVVESKKDKKRKKGD